MFDRQWWLVLLSIAFADVTWVLYIRYVSERRHWRAATVAVVLLLTGAFATISYIEDQRMLIPAALGAFIGTLVSSWWSSTH